MRVQTEARQKPILFAWRRVVTCSSLSRKHLKHLGDLSNLLFLSIDANTKWYTWGKEKKKKKS